MASEERMTLSTSQLVALCLKPGSRERKMNSGTLVILLNTQIFMGEIKSRISELKQLMELQLILYYLKVGILSLFSMAKLTN